jgi:hypothetical protein
MIAVSGITFFCTAYKRYEDVVRHVILLCKAPTYVLMVFSLHERE